MHFAMENGQICFSLRKFVAISLAIQKIASDCGCDAVVHLGPAPSSRAPPGNGSIEGRRLSVRCAETSVHLRVC